LKSYFAFFIQLFGLLYANGQVYTNKVVGEKNEAAKDSINGNPHPYTLPICGAKAAAKGYDLDEIIRFNDAVASTSAINFRPCIWVFPFLNVYGIFA